MTAIPVAAQRFFTNARAGSDLPGALRLRRGLAVVSATYAIVLTAASLASGEIPKWGYALILGGAAALWFNRGGAFIRDWLPVILGLYAYSLAGSFAHTLKLDVHYLPQMQADELLFFGHLPTLQLQEWLYDGTTGPIEVFAVLAYVSHFFGPVLLGLYAWWNQRRDAFVALMFGILGVSLLGDIVFVLAPTAPPWMAAEQGHIPEVHHLLKTTLYDLNLAQAADLVGDSSKYNTVAAMPSLHAAWPIVSLLVAVRYGLPRWITVLAAFQFAAVVFSIVYTGDHYVSDAIAGVALAFVASLLVERALGRRRNRRNAIPWLRALARDEQGQALIEYALIISLVSIVSVVVLSEIGGKVASLLEPVTGGF